MGIIGYPLKHTISPQFQQAALDYYGLDIKYQAWEVNNEDLPTTVERMRLPDYVGANITAPYKQEVIKFMDVTDDAADLLGAVNTIVHREGKLIGYNTDVYGFVQALEKEGKFNPENRSAIVLGSGGSARAVCFALLFEGIDNLTIISRTMAKGDALIKDLNNFVSSKKKQVRLSNIEWKHIENRGVIGSTDLVVNCTTIGMRHTQDELLSPLPEEAIPENILVYDLVYNPEQTPLLKSALKAGARTLNGLPMLVYQGAAAFSLWVGKEPPVDIMFNAAKKALC